MRFFRSADFAVLVLSAVAILFVLNGMPLEGLGLALCAGILVFGILTTRRPR